MKVYISGQLYDSSQIPIVLKLDSDDRSIICGFAVNNQHYLFYPQGKLTSDEAQDLLEKAKNDR